VKATPRLNDDQIAPPEDWRTWVLLGGRGSGKTFAGGFWMNELARGADMTFALGDVLLFRMAAGCPAKHCAVLSAVEGPERRMIHAYWGRSVVESWMGPWWRRRLVAAFRWPEPLAGI